MTVIWPNPQKTQIPVPEFLWKNPTQYPKDLNIGNNWSTVSPGQIISVRGYIYQNNKDERNIGTYVYYATEALVTTDSLYPTRLFERIRITEGDSNTTTKWTLSGEFYYPNYWDIKNKKNGLYWYQYDPSADVTYAGEQGKVVVTAADRALALNTTGAVKFYLLDKKGNGAPIGPVSPPTTIPAVPNTTVEQTTTTTVPISSPTTSTNNSNTTNNQATQSPTSKTKSALNNELKRTNGRSGKPTPKKTKTTPSVATPVQSSPSSSSITTVNVATTSIPPTGTIVPADKPYILQRYVLSTEKDIKENVSNYVVMDIVPNSFEFTQMSASWAEVDRGGTYSLTDWNKYNLMKVSFKFVVSARSGAGLHDDIVDVRNNAAGQTLTTSVSVGASTPLDGLNASIDSQLEIIRKMSMAPFPVTLVNCSPYLTNNIRFPYKGKEPEGIAFVINDMSVNITRFAKGSIKHASVAEVTVSLTEYVTPQPGTLVKLPPLKKAIYKPGKNDQRSIDNQYLSVQYIYGKSAAGWPETPTGSGGTDTAVIPK
jgi:hypothetical protein